jgi:hypothetical protein
MQKQMETKLNIKKMDPLKSGKSKKLENKLKNEILSKDKNKFVLLSRILLASVKQTIAFEGAVCLCQCVQAQIDTRLVFHSEVS